MSSPQLSSNRNYHIEEILDSGNFGSVYKILVHEDHRTYAVKQVNLEKFNDSERENALKSARIEYNLLKRGIPNVIRSFGSSYDSTKDVFKYSLEYKEMNLAQYVRSKKVLTFHEFAPIFSDILRGLWGLLSKADTIHRDIKPENILMDFNGRAIIGDFGISKVCNNFASALGEKEISAFAGTPAWMSPEMRKLENNNSQSGTHNGRLPKSDVFSIGLIALFCLDTEEFQKQSNLNKDEKALEFYLDQFRLRCCEKKFFYMLKSMLSFSPSARPFIQQLFEDFPEFTLDVRSQLQRGTSEPVGLYHRFSNDESGNFKGIHYRESNPPLGSPNIEKGSEVSYNFPSNPINPRTENITSQTATLSKAKPKAVQEKPAPPKSLSKSSIGFALEQISLPVIDALREKIEPLDKAILKAESNSSTNYWELPLYNKGSFIDEGLKFSTNIMIGLKNLKSLYLNLDGTSITDDGISYFSQAINTMVNLSSLGVSLCCKGVTDKGGQALSSAIAKLTNLKILALSFERTSISDQTLQSLSESLNELRFMSELFISLSGLARITDTGLIRLSDSLKNMMNLEIICLNFNDTAATLKSVSELCIAIASLASFSRKYSDDPRDIDSNITGNFFKWMKDRARVELINTCSHGARKKLREILKPVKGNIEFDEFY